MKQFKSYAIAAFSILFISGCATTSLPPTPSYTVPDNGKIAIIINASDKPTHTHIGTTVFNNFEKKYDFDWQIESEIYNAFKDSIEQGTNLELVKLDQYKGDTGYNFVSPVNKQWTFDPNHEQTRKELIEQGYYAVIQIREAPTLALMQCSQFGCTNFHSQGYGLFTRSIFGLDNYYASASFRFSIELLNAPVEIGAIEPIRNLMNYQVLNTQMSSFQDPAVFDAMTEKEMEPVKQRVIGYFKSLALTVKPYLTKSRNNEPEINTAASE